MSTPYAQAIQLHTRLHARKREAERAGDVELSLRLVRLLVKAHLRCDRRQEKCGSCGVPCIEPGEYAESPTRGRLCHACWLIRECW